MHYLYKITNQLNNKIYIGQTINPEYRWKQHCAYGKQEKSPQYIHRAMAKYGIDNFIFEVLVSSCTREDADEVEKILINQYNSQNKEFGYNIKPGGMTAGHSEETKQKLREATQRQIQEKGHPAQGTKRTEEQRKTLSEAQQNRNNNYTPEMRQRMSEAHLGEKHSKEAVENRRASLMVTIAKKQELKLQSGEIKCHAPDCDRSGFDQDYRIVNNVRYCAKHAWRLKTKGTLYLPKN